MCPDVATNVYATTGESESETPSDTSTGAPRLARTGITGVSLFSKTLSPRSGVAVNWTLLENSGEKETGSDQNRERGSGVNSTKHLDCYHALQVIHKEEIPEHSSD